MEKFMGGLFALSLLFVGFCEIPGMMDPRAKAVLFIMAASIYLIKTLFYKK